MSEKNNLMARYNGVFSNSIFKTKGDNQNPNIAFETQKVDKTGKEYLVFNDKLEDMPGEYGPYEYSFASAIDFMCKEKLLDTGKVNRFKKSASELNNILTQKNNYDTREKIFDVVNKARIAYVDLMNILKEISDGLKTKKVNFDQNDVKETTEMLIDNQLGILMTNKVFFVDLGSRLCNALDQGDKFDNVSLDDILRNPTENTKVYYVDQKPEELEKFGSGAVNATYLFDNSKVLKFGDIFLDTLTPTPSKMKVEFEQERAMGNFDVLVEFNAEIKKLRYKAEDKKLDEFFDLIDSDPLFLKQVLSSVHALDDPGDEKTSSEFFKRYNFNRLSGCCESPLVRNVMQKIKPIVTRLSDKSSVLVNTAFRANISYELASMLGFNAIVKTQTGITPKDYVSIMDRVEGKSFKNHFKEKKDVTVEITKDYIESAMELMVIDYILGQSDRHDHNYFFNNATETLVGIDNDYILPIEEKQKQELDKYNNLSTKLPIITEKIKESILNLNDKDFESILEFSLTNKKLAVDQAKKRLYDLKDYVRNVEILDINEDKDKIINKFIEPVKQFKEQTKKQIGGYEANIKRRLYGNPIYANAEVFKNNIDITKANNKTLLKKNMETIEKAREKSNDSHVNGGLDTSHTSNRKSKINTKDK